jgi:hypothetical protein
MTKSIKESQRSAELANYTKYGLTPLMFRTLWARSGGKCEICSLELTSRAMGHDTERGLESLANVDHCHEKGEVRGLLCNPCNRAVGLLKDSAESAQRAAAYLSRGTTGAKPDGRSLSEVEGQARNFILSEWLESEGLFIDKQGRISTRKNKSRASRAADIRKRQAEKSKDFAVL